MAARLSHLLAGLSGEVPDIAVTGLASDSREVRPGDAFFAVPGTRADGLAFAPMAVAAGAVAVIGQTVRPPALPAPIGYVQVADMRIALAQAASRFYPHQPGTVVAVTGTAGKSSVADFARQLMASAGAASASLGTLGVTTSSGAHYGSLTTPDPISLHRTLDQLAGEGVTHLAMEASSHGIDQHRLDGVRLSGVAFTNLGRDHLDYHGTMEAYLAAKIGLFARLAQPGTLAVVNADGAHAADFVAAARERGLRLVTTGHAGEDLRVEHAGVDGFAQELTLSGSLLGTRRVRVRLPLAGAFQVENALVAAALAIGSGLPCDAVLAGLDGLQGVSGRLERVGEVDGALCVVDYAHKPEALEQVLVALRPFATGRLVCVFGCGGDRDRGKRPIMGAIAARGADIVIVTDDNPRSETPAAIRAEILAAAPGARDIGDRREAIHHAVGLLRSGDVLIVAGKGHETGQIMGSTVVPFSDQDEVRAAIAARLSAASRRLA
jgi:UDP-N-acetylmuramoyl-L-alanyl-D-glutamate--2,6-diaminopimelate ligase